MALALPMTLVLPVALALVPPSAPALRRPFPVLGPGSPRLRTGPGRDGGTGGPAGAGRRESTAGACPLRAKVLAHPGPAALGPAERRTDA